MKRSAQLAQQREEILASARQLFADRPFDDVTMTDVASAAGVARATVFNHFTSKRGLVDAMTLGVLRYFQTMIDQALANQESPTCDLVQDLFSAMGAEIPADRMFFRSVFREFSRFELGYDEGSECHTTALRARLLLIELIDRGIARADITAAFPADVVAAAFADLSNGCIHAWLWGDADTDLSSLLSERAELLIRAIRLEVPAL